MAIKTKKTLDLFKFVLNNTKKTEKDLSGVLFSKGYSYVTDKKLLLKIKSDYLPKQEGKVFDSKNKEIKGVKPHDFEKVFTLTNKAKSYVLTGNLTKHFEDAQVEFEAYKKRFELKGGKDTENLLVSLPVKLDKDCINLLIDANYVEKVLDIIRVYPKGEFGYRFNDDPKKDKLGEWIRLTYQTKDISFVLIIWNITERNRISVIKKY